MNDFSPFSFALGFILIVPIALFLSHRRQLLLEKLKKQDRFLESLTRDHRTDLDIEKHRLQAVLDGMVEGVLVTDAAGRVLLANPALTAILSLSSSVLGHTLLEVSRHPEIRETIARVLSEQKICRKEISFFIDGEEKGIVMSSSPLAAGTVSVFYDITELRRLENVRKDFVANVSHELKTPLTCIRGYAETLKSGALADAEAATRFIDKIEKNATQLQALVEDLLQISEIEAGRLGEKAESLNLKDKVQAVLEDFARPGETRKIMAHIPEDLRVKASQESLRRILINLIDNAVKYSEAGTEVSVKAEKVNVSCRITVKDQGIGLSEADSERVFERFYRVDKARTRSAASGTGLGLSIVKHLVAAQGGEVGVNSRLGEGSEFWFTLPLG